MKIKGKTTFVCFSVILACLCILASVCYTQAGSYIDGTFAGNYLDAPAVGPNVEGFISAGYHQEGSTFHCFVSQSECLKRLEDAKEGVLVAHTEILSKEEFNQLNPHTLKGMIDSTGKLSIALGGTPGVVAVINEVTEYKRVGKHFVARVAIKFVNEMRQ